MIPTKRAPVIQDDASHNIYVYGTLMNPKTRDYVLKHKEGASKGALKGYKKVPYTTKEGKDFDTIERTGNHNDKIQGDVLMVSQADLDKLIKWEDQYDLVWVQLDDGRHAQAFKLIKKDELSKEK